MSVRRSSRPKKPINVVEPVFEEEKIIRVSQSWMTAKEMIAKGLNVKQGKFSDDEKKSLNDAVDRFLKKHGLDRVDLPFLLYKRRNGELVENNQNHVKIQMVKDDFLPEVARVLPNRPMEATYRCLQRMLDENNHKGAWSKEEDDRLRHYHQELNGNWVEIGEKLGRTSNNCRDRFVVLQRKETVSTGSWTQEEVYKFKNACRDLLQQGKDVEDFKFWEQVAEKVKTRSAIQCKIKWSDTNFGRNALMGFDNVIPAVENPPAGGATWSKQDTIILINKLRQLKDVTSDTQISWKSLSSPEWPWSRKKLSQHWHWIRARGKKVLGQDATFRQIVEWAHEKNQPRAPKPNLGPKKVARQRRASDYPSSEWVSEEDLSDEDVGRIGMPFRESEVGEMLVRDEEEAAILHAEVKAARREARMLRRAKRVERRLRREEKKRENKK